jgi:peroxiredoxin
LLIQLNTSTMHLEEEPLDIGYASEKVMLSDIEDKERTIGGQNGKTQILLSVPFIDEPIQDELKEIAKELPKGGEYEVTASLIVANDQHQDPNIEGLEFLIDTKGEFGDWYGTRIADGECANELTKALIIVSKDGAVFYDDFVSNLHDRFNQETLMRKIYAAQTCYTGKGCH